MSGFNTRCIKELTHKTTEPRDCGKFFRILGLHKSLFLNLEPANPQEAADSQGTPNLTSGILVCLKDFLGGVVFILEKTQLYSEMERKISQS